MEHSNPTTVPDHKPLETKAQKYDQDRIWTDLSDEGMVDIPEKISSEMSEILKDVGEDSQLSTVVHLLFDRPVTPEGSLFSEAIALTVSQPRRLTEDQLRIRRYVPTGEGRVQTVNDIPVGDVYNALTYWGGAERVGYWDLAEPIQIDPNRKGNPYFMDNSMVAFGAVFRNAISAGQSLLSLFHLLKNGMGNVINPVGIVINLKLSKKLT